MSARRTLASRWSRLWRILLAIACLAVGVAVFYRAVVFADRIGVGYDVFTYFYPNETYAAEALRAGRLPLWNPYLFTGVPFLANSQTAIFYPGNLLFVFLSVPRAYVVTAVLHAFLGALGTYFFARRFLSVGNLAGVVAGLIFALGGFSAGLFGHLNQLQVVALAPWALGFFVLALRGPSWRWGLATAAVIGLQALAGHTQALYQTLVLLALLFLFEAARHLWASWRGWRARAKASASNGAVAPSAGSAAPPFWRKPALCLGLLVLAVGLGFALAAVQLLPTSELSGLSVRSGGLTFEEAKSFSLPPWMLAKSLLPSFGEEPIFSEWLGYVGIVGIVLAAWGLVAQRRRPETWALVLVAVVALVLALGAATPLFALAYKIPGMNLFRVPARWLFPYTLALSCLAALGIASLRADLDRKRWVTGGACLLVAAIAGLAIAYKVSALQPALELPSLWTMAAWVLVGVLACALAFLALRGTRGGLARSGLVALLGLELVLGAVNTELNRPNLPEAQSSLRPSVSYLLANNDGVYRNVATTENTFDPGDLKTLRSMLSGVLSERQVYDFVVAHKWKETLAPNLPLQYGLYSLDGYDGGVLPLRDYANFKSLLSLEGEPGDGRLREQLREVPEAGLLGWLNVRYFVMDRVRDAWVDGVYYDLGITTEIGPGQTVRVPPSAPAAASSVGLVLSWEGGSAPQAEGLAAWLTITDDEGRDWTVPLRYGIEVLPSACVAAESVPTGAKLVRAERDDPSRCLYLTRIALPKRVNVVGVTLQNQTSAAAGPLRWRALSLIDDAVGTSKAVAISDGWRIVHLGDVKIYENSRVLQRAFWSNGVRLVESREKALEAMSEPGFDPRAVSVVAQGDWPNNLAVPKADGPGVALEPGEAKLLSYEPERVSIETRSEAAGILVLTDSYFPGWKVSVDGREQPIVRTNYLFRGVPVEAGRHEVVFTFEPMSVRLGGIVSLLAVLLLIAAPAFPWAVRRWRSARK